MSGHPLDPATQRRYDIAGCRCDAYYYKPHRDHGCPLYPWPSAWERLRSIPAAALVGGWRAWNYRRNPKYPPWSKYRRRYRKVAR